MAAGQHEDRDRSFAIAERAGELMREYGSSASPHAYTVWYTYVSGRLPALNEAVKRLTGKNGTLSDADIDELHDAHIDPQRLSVELERTNAGLIAEVEGIMETIELSLGSTAEYDASLREITRDLSDADTTRNRMREIVATLIANTRDVCANNRTLEARMRESRREIETLHETLEAARLESLTDPLTGLSNRKHFEAMLHREMDCAQSAEWPASLIVLDIDFFKRFNDIYGHLTGDQVLRLVAVVMRETIRTGATLARFGGEEFAILMPATARETASELAEALRTAIMGRELVKRSTGESLGKVTVSVGIALRRPDDTAVSFLERADSCLYAAKRSGRNRVVDDGEAEVLPDVA